MIKKEHENKEAREVERKREAVEKALQADNRKRKVRISFSLNFDGIRANTCALVGGHAIPKSLHPNWQRGTHPFHFAGVSAQGSMWRPFEEKFHGHLSPCRTHRQVWL
jgi:hypothetical protein